MTDLNRRQVLAFLGQSIAAAACSQAALPGGSSDEWERYFPGNYDSQDRKILTAFQAKLERIRHYGPIDVPAVVSGKLTGAPPLSWNPMEFNYRVTRHAQSS